MGERSNQATAMKREAVVATQGKPCVAFLGQSGRVAAPVKTILPGYCTYLQKPWGDARSTAIPHDGGQEVQYAISGMPAAVRSREQALRATQQNRSERQSSQREERNVQQTGRLTCGGRVPASA